VTKRYITYISAILLPVTVATLLAWFGNGLREPFDPPLALWEKPVLEAVEFRSVDDMESYFRKVSYTWIPASGASVPPIEVSAIPADISKVKEVSRKKSIFFRALLPLVLEENDLILRQQSKLLALQLKSFDQWTPNEHLWFSELLDWYRLPIQSPDQVLFSELLARVDSIPTELVLAQAANESGWGTSRFARIGNNLFGMWTFNDKNGLIPKQRAKGEKHAVQVFASLRESVRAYMRNLNTHKAYQSLRESRMRSREQGKELDGRLLAQGLLRYSIRGKDYVDELQSMIRTNQLATVRAVSLRLAQEGLDSEFPQRTKL